MDPGPGALTRRNAVLLMHLTVFIWGWTGIFGKWIHLDAVPIVYARSAIGCFGLMVFAWAMGRSLSPRVPDLGRYVLTGLIILVHWVTFYLAIKLGSASVAVACLSTGALFTALLAPLWTKERVSGFELVLSVVVIGALLLIFGLETNHRLAIGLGVLSALLSSWFGIVNSRLVQRGDAMRICFYELLTAGVGLGIWLAWTGQLPPPLWHMPARDSIALLILGLVCTSFAFTAGIIVLRRVTPFTMTLTVNLEPVYTMAIALLLWPESEKMHLGSYLGFAIILLCISLNAWRQRKLDAGAERQRILMGG